MKLRRLILPIVIALFLTPVVSSSAPLMDFGVVFGLSTPNDQMNNVYNEDYKSSIGDFIRDGAESGYHVGARGRLKLSDNFVFVGGIGWHSFPESKIEIRDPETEELLTTLSTKTNIVPISAGVNIYPINSEVGVYGVGELTYNHISSSVDATYGDLPVQLSTSPKDSRFGFGIGAGLDVQLFVLKLNLEAKYNYTNLIGKDSNEDDKTYFSLSLGVFF